ncbi:hypothetical protein ACK56M_17850 [Pseudomonas sp. s4]|uniref:hypothetical protein n=1 Tax=Pseudomonas sp. s4 TaxID=353218 RepID=UPI00398D57FA
MSSMFHEAFKIRQIVLVNSGAYCYAKIRIDQHTALLGANNSGKTSLLNALKFFLLPEENLNDCVRKFGFKNADGFYSKEQSFGFYFPDNSSFLILEAENPHGPFCTVINPGLRSFSYERTCVPVPYSAIEHVFWDHESLANNGAGAPITGLSCATVAAQLKTVGGLVVRDVENIKSRFYRHHPSRPDLGRFCLLPLSQGGKSREIEAWKKLIHLAFDIAAKDKRTLPDTIATIIEGKKDRKEAELNVNLPAILERYSALKSTKLRLQGVRAAKPLWDQFESRYFALLDNGTALINQLQGAAATLEDLDGSHAERHQKKIEHYHATSLAAKALTIDAERIAAQCKEKIGGIRELERQFGRIKQDSSALSAIIHTYPNMATEEIIEAIEAATTEDQQKVVSLKDAEVFRQEFEQRARELNADQARAAVLKSILKDSKSTVLDLLPVESSTVLYSLNPVAFSIERDVLEEHQQAALRAFTALFGAHENALVFLDQTTPVPIKAYDAAMVTRERDEELATLSRRMRTNQQRITEMAGDARQSLDQLAMKVRVLESQIDKDKANIGLLKRKEFVETEFARVKLELARANDELLQFTASHREISEQLAEAKELQGVANQELEASKQLSDKLSGWSRRVKELLFFRLDFLREGLASAEQQLINVDDTLINNLESRAYELSKDFDALKKASGSLLDAVPDVETEFEPFSSATLTALRPLYERYALLYGRLDLEEYNHDHHVSEHNADTRLQMQSIEHAKRLIADFIKRIESHLADIKVSNIDEVCIEYTLHPQFDELLKTVKSVNMLGVDLPADVLYERIGSFSSEFFDGDQRRDGRLNMARLLMGVEYKVKLAGRDYFTSESQSTGTSVMINSRLLAFLLKELLQVDTQVSLPLLIDEISNLDAKNLGAARDIAEADGFFIFGATPDLTPNIGKVIGNYVNLDYFRANELSYNRERTILYTGINESLTATVDRSA